MTFTGAIQDVLQADSGAGGVNTLMTGGIYTLKETGPNGIDRQSVPNAYVTSGATLGLLKPTLLITAGAAVQFGGGQVRDKSGQFQAMRQRIELWFYNGWQANAYTVLEQARQRAYGLLHEQRITGGTNKVYTVRELNHMDDLRAPELNHAALLRADYEVIFGQEP